MEQYDDERRKRERRVSERRDTVCSGADNQKAGDNTQREKRQGLRLAYPLAAAPEIMNMRLQVVGISAKAIRFFVPDFIRQKLTLKNGSKLNIVIKFHDGHIAKRSGTITRQEQCQEGREHFVCLFERLLPKERIDKEHAYLLKNFPDFCSIVLDK